MAVAHPPSVTELILQMNKTRSFPVYTVLFVLIVAGALTDFFVLRRGDDDSGSPKSAEATPPTKTEPATAEQVTAPAPITREVGDWAALDDPTKDGWTTEVLSDRAQKQLKAIGKILLHAADVSADVLAPMITEDFRCADLVPPLTTVFSDGAFDVQRGVSTELSHDGADGFAAAAGKLDLFDGGAASRFKFKLFRIKMVDDKTFTTRQYFSLTGRSKSAVVEQNATWDSTWKRDGDKVRLASIRVAAFEVARTQTPSPLFADCTEAVLGKDPSYAKQILAGYHQTGSRYQDLRYFSILGTPGVAIGDVNGDGLEDLYLCGEEGLPNRLYVQQPDGTARDVSKESGVDWIENSRSALLVDLDNDGDQDLVIAITGGAALCENDGTGKFTMKGVAPTAEDTMSVSAVDANNDGLLDLYMCVYYQTGVGVRAIPAAQDGFVVHDANNGGPNSLLRNDGNWKFTDVTKEVGLDAMNSRFSFAAAWDDFDNDGDMDCYVANDYGRDNLYRNDGGKFVDISKSARAEDSAGGMSISWGDFDRDGWMDVFVSNMFSAAGGRITRQEKFKRDSEPDGKKRLQRLSRGNTLMRNRPDKPQFDHVSAVAGVEMGRWAWGSHFVDVNNDGWEDLMISNGYVTGDQGTGDL